MIRFSRFARASCLLLLMLAVCPAGPALPRPLPASARVQAQPAGEFVGLLQQIAQAYRIGFIVEAMPLNPTTNDERLVRLIADPDTAASIKVAALAERFDYSIVNKPGAYLLVKKHTHPLDFPDISHAELRASLDDFIAILDVLMPPIDRDTLQGESERGYIVRQLFASLTPEQRERMKDPQPRVRVRDMTPPQRAMARQLALRGDLGDLRLQANALRVYLGYDEVGKIQPVGNSADKLGLAVTMRDVQGQSVPAFTPFLNPDPARPAGKSFEAECRLLLESYEGGDDSTTETLVTLAQRLNAIPSAGTHITFSVDEELRDKRVLLVGADGLDPILRFTWAAAVYGLRVVAPDPATRRISRPPLRRLDDPTQVFVHLRDTLPAPLLTFYGNGERGISPTSPEFDMSGNPDPRWRPRTIESGAATLLDLRMASLRKVSPNRFPLPVSALKARERFWLLNYGVSIRESLPRFAVRRKQLATKVTGLDDLFVVVTQSESSDFIGFLRVKPDGSPDNAAMTFSMTPPGYRLPQKNP